MILPGDIDAAWAWAIGGMILMVGELLAPGIFLIWLGLGAVLTGLVLSGVTLSWQGQVLLFVVLASIAVLLGRRVLQGRPSALNRRGHSLVGREFILDAPIVQGVGRIKLDDTSWRITGADAPAGTRIRVLSLDGATLTVTSI